MNEREKVEKLSAMQVRILKACLIEEDKEMKEKMIKQIDRISQAIHQLILESLNS